MSDLKQAIVEAIWKLNRTDGEGMTIAASLQSAAEASGLVKDCDSCGDIMLGTDRFCTEGCKEEYNNHLGVNANW